MFRKSSLIMATLLKMRYLSTCVPNIPLTEAIPGFNPNFSSHLLSSNSAVSISKLGNGLTVASQNKFGMHCTIGGMRGLLRSFSVMLKAGPRYESGTVSGVSHFIEKLGFHVGISFLILG